MAKSPKQRFIPSGYAWINQIFEAGQVNKGNVVRRYVDWVEKQGSHNDLVAAVQANGFHMAIIGNQYVILCDPSGHINVVC